MTWLYVLFRFKLSDFSCFGIVIFCKDLVGNKQIYWYYYSLAMQECKLEIKTKKLEELPVPLAEAGEKLAVRLIKCCFENIYRKKKWAGNILCWLKTAVRLPHMLTQVEIRTCHQHRSGVFISFELRPKVRTKMATMTSPNSF